jgi:hypothetical protein
MLYAHVKTKKKLFMTKDKNKKSVFAIINLANTETQQKSTAQFATQMAKSFDLDVVLYPQNNETRLSFKEGFRRVWTIASKISEGVAIKVSKEEINKFMFFTSLPDIAAKERAAFIVMGIKEETRGFFGKAVWDITQKSRIPILLLPWKIAFNPFGRITMAVDAERKLQKMNIVNMFAKKFNSKINIFVEHSLDASKDVTNKIMVGHVERFLSEHDIPFITTKARKTKDFPKRLCKFAGKHSDLLIVEVDPGRIDSTIKQNIETLLNVHQHFPVLFIKTQIVGNLQNFN